MPTENFDQHLAQFCEDAENRADLKLLEIAARLAKDIRDRRKSLQIGQVQLAEAVGTTQSRISQIEDPTYGKLTLNTLVRVAEALQCELEISLKVKDIPLEELFVQDTHSISVDFVKCSDLANSHADVCAQSSSEVRPFDKDRKLKAA